MFVTDQRFGMLVDAATRCGFEVRLHEDRVFQILEPGVVAILEPPERGTDARTPEERNPLPSAISSHILPAIRSTVGAKLGRSKRGRCWDKRKRLSYRRTCGSSRPSTVRSTFWIFRAAFGRRSLRAHYLRGAHGGSGDAGGSQSVWSLRLWRTSRPQPPSAEPKKGKGFCMAREHR